jgi:hypothetical protein
MLNRETNQGCVPAVDRLLWQGGGGGWSATAHGHMVVLIVLQHAQEVEGRASSNNQHGINVHLYPE